MDNNKTNINLAKIKESQQLKDHFYRINSEEYKSKLEKIKTDREATKSAIINKVKNTTIDDEPSYGPTCETNLTKSSNILKNRITIVNEPSNHQITNISLEQEKLSYTMQIDQITDKDRENYRNQKKFQAETKIYETFASLNPKINRIYYITTIVLLLMIMIVCGIIYSIRN
ncbi:MAG: hypothetical protein LBT75_00295 [Bacilli bacterium]|jgi:hypothetical protein|nr:hypothetical protein [Bacilli bacterium]